MRTITTIAGREVRSLFLSPMAWAILAVFQAVLAYVFLVQLERFGRWQPQLQQIAEAPGVTELVVVPVFKTAGFVFLVLVPLLTMNLFADERRRKTLPLLLSSPASSAEIVLGKFLGAGCYMLCLLALCLMVPLTVTVGTSLDLGHLSAGILGLGLLLAGATAVGLFVSAMTELPVVAAVNSFGLLLLAWILDSGGGAGIVSYVSLKTHFQPFLDGLVRTQDLAYFGLVVVLFLALSVRRLSGESHRER